MAILLNCVVILLSLAEPKAASPPVYNTTGCKLMSEQPKNSLVSCTFDRELGGYTDCLYLCRAGYYFEGLVTNAWKFQSCINGSWFFGDLGNCVPPEEGDSTEPCSSKPRSPINSSISCKFSTELMKYTNCNFTCRKGSFFEDGTDEKTSVCRNGSWLPINHCDCLRPETLTPNFCSSTPKPPLNSVDYCIFDKQAQGYVKCKYHCKRGYHFYSNVSRLTQHCVGGSWKSGRARDCIAEKIHGPPCWKKMDGPENSFTYCRVDNHSVGYSECRYTCRVGYYFHGEVYTKTRVCINGEWTPSKIGICVKASERYSNTALQCFEKPLPPPRRSSVSCVFNENLGMYTSCSFTCFEGYHFVDMQRVKIQNCVGERWDPIRLENCNYQMKKLKWGLEFGQAGPPQSTDLFGFF